MSKVQYQVVIKRIYDLAESTDGYRVLVDRLWPRAVSKTRAALNEWNREVAPTTALRQWFRHRAEEFPKFSEDYTTELNQNAAAFELAGRCKDLLTEGPVTLLYGAKDEEHNHAIVLRQWLIDHI